MGKLVGKDIIPHTNEIINMYNSNNSTYKIAEYYNTHSNTIRCLLVKNNIIRRNIAETNHIRFANYNVPSKELQECLTGWMLGDGSIHFTGKQAYFCIVSKHEEYVDHIKKLFENEGFKCRKYHNMDKKYKTWHYRLFTNSTLYLSELYSKWYKNGKKIVPSDIDINKNSIKYWIIDDGTRDKNKGYLRFCTCAFSIEECEFLSSKLNNILSDSGASWVIEKQKYPRIYMPRIFAEKLFDILDKCPISCFEYKWKNCNKIKELVCLG